MYLLKRSLLILLLPVYIYADIDAIAQKIQDDFDGQNIDLLLEGPIQIAYPESNVICSGEAKETYEEEIVSCLKTSGQQVFFGSTPELLSFLLNYQEENRFTIQTEETEEFEGATYQAIVKQDNVYYTEKDNRFFTYAKIPIEALANTNNIDELRTELANNIVYRIFSDIYSTGEYYIDENGIIQLLQGTAFYPEGVYEGKFLDGFPSGFGILKRYDGYTYEGSWSAGYYSGYGELIYDKENHPEKWHEDWKGIIVSQKGNWLRNQLNGLTETIWNDGEIFIGLYLDGLPNGYGERFFSDGTIWKGIFEGSTEIITSGHIYENGNLMYHGTLENILTEEGYYLQRHGTGTIYGYDSDGKNDFIYTGDMRNDMPHGQGLYIEGQSQCEGKFYESNLIEGKCADGEYAKRTGTFLTDKSGVWALKKGTFEFIVPAAYHWKFEGSWDEDGQAEDEILWTNLDPDTKEILEQQIFKYDESGEFSGMSDSKNYAAFNYFNEKRIALVIGNADYSDSYGYGNLENPVNDAELMTLALEKAGFEVSYVEDANNADFMRALAEFGSQISIGNNVTALFYYSGHGMQVDGQNYLVPINANIQNEADLQLENISTRRIMNIFAENLNGTNIIILDACRNNPFERNFLRSSENGLSVMSAPKGTYIAYSTAPGELAADGTGGNSIFTKQLAENLLVEGITIEEVFKLTRRQVAEQTNNKQIPWSSSSLLDDFYFIQ